MEIITKKINTNEYKITKQVDLTDDCIDKIANEVCKKMMEKCPKPCEDVTDTKQPEPCEDAVSREAVLNGAITHYSVSGANIAYRNAVPVEYIKELPSVKPQRKKGGVDSG